MKLVIGIFLLCPNTPRWRLKMFGFVPLTVQNRSLALTFEKLQLFWQFKIINQLNLIH